MQTMVMKTGQRVNEIRTVGAAEWVAACLEQVEQGRRLIALTAFDKRQEQGVFLLRGLFGDEAASTTHVLQLEIDEADPVFPSVTPLIPAANWAEREVQDMFGLKAVGHPDPRRLVMHPGWPDGFYPLRKDFDPLQSVPKADGTFTFDKIERNGINDIPVGPIHAGIIEPGHFRFQTVGEEVLRLDAQLFYTHRGLEKKLEGRSPQDALVLIEQICGVCVASHSVSFTQAAEQIGQIDVPKRAQYLRTIMLEMERLYNHIGDVGNMCAGFGFAVGNSHGMRLKEELLRLNHRYFGHRYLRGYNRVGGVSRDLSDRELTELSDMLTDLEQDVREWIEVLREHDISNERMTGTGRLDPDIARDWGAVGPAARASGVKRDARIHFPYAAYGELSVEMMTETDGDALARMKVRLREAIHSFALIRQAIGQCPKGSVRSESAKLPSRGWSYGITESPRGENVHALLLDADGLIERCHIRSATYCNWAVVPFAVPGNILPDFPLINKSFELCYACCDR